MLAALQKGYIMTASFSPKNTRLLADKIYVDNDTHKTLLNNNDLIIGPAGAGKTRGYVMPNLFSCNESMIIADTKNTLYKTFADYLKKQGITVYQIDFSGISESDIGYNPFDYIKKNSDGSYNEFDILLMAEQICPMHTISDPYWDISAKYVIASMIAYVCECLPQNEHSIASLAQIATDFSTYESLLDELAIKNSNSIAVKYYNVMKAARNADKTFACIASFVFEKLIPLDNKASNALFNAPKRLCINSLADKKSVLFLNISDTNHSSDTLISLFYSQALSSLMTYADISHTNRLNVPVRFIFDDFAAGTTLPNFDKIISVIRSREIYVSIIIQSLSQLESLYSKPAAQTIVNNCDHWLYLGGHDLETISQISLKADKMPKNIANMPLDKVLIFERGKPAVFASKYDISMCDGYKDLCTHHTDISSKDNNDYTYQYDGYDLPFA